MTNKQLHLDVNERRLPNAIRRELTLKADGESDSIEIFYEIDNTAIGELAVFDGFLQAVLLHCMKRGLPVRVHGKLSTAALRNLHEFQRVWSLWRPDLYRRVDLIPDAVICLPPISNKVIQAYSAGVDSTFTLISNKELRREQGGYDVSGAVLVHGFDVHYENLKDFQALAERAKKALSRYDVELSVVRTNSRALNIQSWWHSFTLQLAACLHQFSNHYGIALLASAEPYDALDLKMSSNPITDPLLSGDLMQTVHDGAGYSRTEKVEAISRFPDLVAQLKVCWEGAVQHSNCGKCEKCLRTRLNFAAVGETQPACFSGEFNPKSLRRLRARSKLQVEELKSILNYIRRRSLTYGWTGHLQRRIVASQLSIQAEKILKLRAASNLLRASVRRSLPLSQQLALRSMVKYIGFGGG